MAIVEKISIGDHKNSILDRLNEYRSSSSFCDAIVVVQGREFPVHRAVLAACGGYFAGIFTADMREQAENKVELNDLDSDIAEDLFDFIYTGDIELSPDKAKHMVMVADYLLLDKLKVAVDEYMAKQVKNMSEDNFSTYQFAVQYKCSRLQEATVDYILHNFESAWTNSQSSLHIDLGTLQKIISNEDLVVRSEEIVIQAVLDWVKYKDERKDNFYTLFSSIRLCSLSENFLYSKVLTEYLVSSDPSCLQLVMESMKNRNTPTTANVPHPRACLDMYTNAILAFPKYRKRSSTVAGGPWCYIPGTKEWYQIPVPDKPSHFGFGSAVYDGKGAMLLIRKNVDSPLIYIDKFDVATCKWSNLDSAVYNNGGFAVCYFQGLLYFIGGENIERGGEKIIVADVKTASLSCSSTLQSVSAINESRKWASVVCDEENIYILGGVTNTRDSQSYQTTRAFESYDPKCNSWTVLPETRYSSVNDTCLIANGKVFRILGMAMKEQYLNEVYDINSSTWSQIPKSPYTLAGGLMVCCDKEMFVIGGATIPPGTYHTNKNATNAKKLHTLTYDTETQDWLSCLDTSLKTKFGSWFLELSGAAVRLPKSSVTSFIPLSDAIP